MTAAPLRDFPLIYLSYDEPWADDGFAQVQSVRPDAQRVHGVEGLHAAHLAAADAAGSPYFLTVDADTALLPGFAEATVPSAYLTPDMQPYWPARNVVNGIISGNGCIKLWPQALIARMRSHEAAPKGRVSLDSDIPLIEPGVTRLVPMPGCYAMVDPAKTAFHAFRAGFRETFFLAWLKQKFDIRGTGKGIPLAEILGIWCNLGRQAENGTWLIYGARLGYFAALNWAAFDPRLVNDYSWFNRFWHDHVTPRIGSGGARCAGSGHRYDSDRLDREIIALGEALTQRGLVPMAELTTEESALVLNADLMPILRTPRELSALAQAFQDGRGVARDTASAAALFGAAVILGDGAAHFHLAQLAVEASDASQAKLHLRSAVASGSPEAPHHLATLMQQDGASGPEIDALLDLAAERGYAEAEAS